MINYQLGFLLGLMAFVYSYLLTEPNAPLHGVYKWLSKFFKTNEREMEGRPIHPLFMVLMYCEKCVAGQCALWLFLWLHFAQYQIEISVALVLRHVFFVCWSIVMAGTIKALYIRLTNNT